MEITAASFAAWHRVADQLNVSYELVEFGDDCISERGYVTFVELYDHRAPAGFLAFLYCADYFGRADVPAQILTVFGRVANPLQNVYCTQPEEGLAVV